MVNIFGVLAVSAVDPAELESAQKVLTTLEQKRGQLAHLLHSHLSENVRVASSDVDNSDG